jgi:predicted DNA-binding protein (MmcQ/YjbR family)
MPGTSEGFPFDDRVLVFKVGGKIFALIDIETAEYVNLKCDPLRAIDLRERHAAVRPGYHMNKEHWNSVYIKELGDQALLKEWTDHSYELIFKSLKKALQQEIKDMAQ